MSDVRVEWYRGGKSTPQEFYLAGYAGVGKSTIARVAIEELQEKCGVKTVCTAAFTGKASSVLRKKGNADADLILLDEVSMVPKDMADDIR